MLSCKCRFDYQPKYFFTSSANSGNRGKFQKCMFNFKFECYETTATKSERCKEITK